MDDSVSTHSVENLAKALKAARENGQQVVPIVGAGLSADCGFPIIATVVRYLARLYHYIQKRGPVCDYREHKDLPRDIFKDHFDRYEQRPWTFLEDFGWPDWFQLNEDLYWKFEVKTKKDKRFKKPVSGEIESAEREELDNLLLRFNPLGVERYSQLFQDTSNALSEFADEKLFNDLKQQDAIRKLKKRIDSRFAVNWSNSAKFDVIGDWSRLILYFTNYRSEYADALFARFGATRKPGQGHRFLAFLSKVLAVRTIITFNFDSLIEEAMEIEGIRCKVFAMERGSGLPYQDLVRDQLSVIKAHGGTHALLLDEQLDRPLSREYLDRFDKIVGKDPILLVMGCSAGDRRLRDLVSHVVVNATRDKSSSEPLSPCVAWLHYESTPPTFIEHKKLKPRTLALRTNNPGATLLHLHSWLTSSNPASRVPYLAHVQQPMELAAVPEQNNDNNGISSRTRKGQFDWIAVTGSKFLTASQLLFKRANYWAQRGYQFIWVDLESLHTFAGVIGSIIDQCRRFDPDLVPSLLPADIDKIGGDVSTDGASLDEVIALAAKRVARALRRARYYLAIDGLGTYGWPATTHHGLTHMAITRGAQDRLENMIKFLRILEKHVEKHELGESRVGVSLDDLTSRHKGLDLPQSAKFKSLFYKARRQHNEPGFNRPFLFEDRFKQLKPDLPIFTFKESPAELKKVLSTDSDEKTDAIIAMVFFSLSCFRRTRPLVATTYLLEPLLGKAFSRDRLQEILNVFIEQGDTNARIWILQQLEGGSYWFNHSIRDQIYARNTEHTATRSMRQCLEVKAGARSNSERSKTRRKTVFQLILAAITHQRISQIWYNQTFVQSRDTFAFLEYTYHRISSIRNLVKLRALAQVGARNRVIAEDLVTGISRCSELIHLLNENEPPFKELIFGDDGPFAGFLRSKPKQDARRGDWCDQARKIEKSLQTRHRRQLHGLYRGWTRAEVILRTQVPAEQLLHWCDELLRDDLVQRCNQLVIDYRENGKKSFEAVFYKFRAGDRGELIDPELDNDGGDLKEFRRFLQDLQVQLWIERSDYLTCISHRRKHLWHSLGEKTREQLGRSKDSKLKQVPHDRSISQRIEDSSELIKRCGVRQCHQLLNIANCKLKLHQELTSDEDALIEETRKTLELLQAIKGRLQKLKPGSKPKTRRRRSSTLTNTNDHDEAWLRLLHLEAETRIRHVSMFSHDGFTGDPRDWKLTAQEVKEAQRVIAQGLEEIGGKDVHTRAAPRSVILHPTADAALYLQYRSLFNMFKGRTDWLADPENKVDGLKEALRSFEMARGGLDNDGPLISALIEIYVAEAAMARARVVLFAHDASEKSFGEAQRMYDSARGALRRAQESLLVSHHHLMWRKLFLRIRTQYYSDRLLLRYAKLQKRVFEEKTRGLADIYKDARDRKKFYEEHGREALLRLRRAYQTLVSALDLYLPHSSKSDPSDLKRFRWLYRMWWELTLCGYAIGCVVTEALEPDIAAKADDYVILQLEWVNTADGVNDSVLKRVFSKNRRRIKIHYDKSLGSTESSHAWQTALNRRRNLITLANELSAKQIQNGSRT